MVGIGTDKRIYVIQRIEQEMRIQLVLQILQFYSDMAVLLFLSPLFIFIPSSDYPENYCGPYGTYVQQGVYEQEMERSESDAAEFRHGRRYGIRYRRSSRI